MSSHEPSVLIFIESHFEDMELMYPIYRLQEAGYRVVVAGPNKGETYLGKHGYPCRADAAIADVQAVEFEGVICPEVGPPTNFVAAIRLNHSCARCTKPGS